MHSIEQARARWGATFASGSDLSALRAAVRSSNEHNPCTNGLRSVCWKAFLVFENLDRSTWPKTIANSRSAYTSLKEHFLRGIKDPDAAATADPLADDYTKSPWNTLRRDELIREEIFQDVERCMTDNSFFREPSTQTLLLDILFIFCKLNADVGYRQGMHELLAPILWVVSRDAVDAQGKTPTAEDKLMLSTLDQRYVEHDAFTIFCIVMQTAKSFYETTGTSRNASSAASLDSAIVVRSRLIHEEYLRRTDPELTKHLTAIEILPQIFVIRWIRLLFGREFPFEDVLTVWDVLFAEDPGLNLVDLICVAMLLRIRWQLLEADYTSTLTLLLRYPVPPPEHSPMTFVEDAIFLRTHLNREGGRHLVEKYTGNATPPDPSSKRANTQTRSLHTPQGSSDHGRMGPIRSPSQFYQESGGIEGILQEAAKGVYKRGEKWGLNQALRGAVQQLHDAANNSPRRSLSNARGSLDEGRANPEIEKQLGERILALEDRNKSLAKILHDAMEDLSAQALKFEEEKAEAAANALTLTVAKLQFVHVYLENSSLPLHDETSETALKEQPDPNDHAKAATPPYGTTSTPSPIPAPVEPSPSSPLRSGALKPLPDAPKTIPESPTRTYVPARRRQPPRSSAHKTLSPSPDPPPDSPFQQSRPGLAQSSFSWMLGEDKATSSFISASPFSPEKERRQSSESKNIARKKASFLFGEEKREKDESKAGGPKVQEDDEGEDGFTMGTLTAPGAGVGASVEP